MHKLIIAILLCSAVASAQQSLPPYRIYDAGTIKPLQFGLNFAGSGYTITNDTTNHYTTVTLSGGITLNTTTPLGGGTGSGSSFTLTCSTCVVTSGSYSNPAWIAALAGSKISGEIPNVPEVSYSPVDVAAGVNAAHAAGSFTIGGVFYISKAATITGVRFFTQSSSGTMKVSIWNNSNSLVATKTVNITGTGVATATFNSPIAFNSPYLAFTVGCFDSTSFYTRYLSGTDIQAFAFPMMAGPNFSWANVNRFSAGDAQPTSNGSTEFYPCEPVFTVP